jgi:hypothetical protein
MPMRGPPLGHTAVRPRAPQHGAPGRYPKATCSKRMSGAAPLVGSGSAPALSVTCTARPLSMLKKNPCQALASLLPGPGQALARPWPGLLVNAPPPHLKHRAAGNGARRRGAWHGPAQPTTHLRLLLHERKHAPPPGAPGPAAHPPAAAPS